MRSTIGRSLTLVIACLVILSGCATGYAPVSDISPYAGGAKNASKYSQVNRITTIPRTYKVKAGDTLYSIAWKYGLDFKILAHKNNINSSYIIYTGQNINMLQQTDDNKVSLKNRPSLNHASKASAGAVSKKSSNKNLQTSSAKNRAQILKIKRSKKAAAKVQKTVKTTSSKLRWSRPAKGRLLNVFSNENKGLNFGGLSGDSVLAAASGKVVYAGNGIIGYGNLIIIKHSQEYLSAYAHNSVILVEENKLIKAGDKIAEIGSTGTTKTMLHFEIRKDGKPVNPLKYLPKK